MELTFSLSELNRKSPYLLESSGGCSFTFVTEQGKKYEIGFIQDLMISDEGVYQFFISTEDHRQASRDRMFHQWFETSMGKEQYCFRGMSIDIDGVDYFASVIMRKDSPRFAAMTEAIDRFIEDFQDKLR